MFRIIYLEIPINEMLTRRKINLLCRPHADRVEALAIKKKEQKMAHNFHYHHERNVQDLHERLFNGDNTLTISKASAMLFVEDDDGDDIDNEIEFLVDCN